MAPDSELAAALRKRRRLNDSRNVRRYLHTKSFNDLAGRSTAPGRARPERLTLRARIVFLVLAAAFWAAGVWCLFR